MPLIPAHGRQKHAYLCENKASMVYIVSPCQPGLPKMTQFLKINKQIMKEHELHTDVDRHDLFSEAYAPQRKSTRLRPRPCNLSQRSANHGPGENRAAHVLFLSAED